MGSFKDVTPGRSIVGADESDYDDDPADESFSSGGSFKDVTPGRSIVGSDQSDDDAIDERSSLAGSFEPGRGALIAVDEDAGEEACLRSALTTTTMRPSEEPWKVHARPHQCLRRRPFELYFLASSPSIGLVPSTEAVQKRCQRPSHGRRQAPVCPGWIVSSRAWSSLSTKLCWYW